MARSLSLLPQEKANERKILVADPDRQMRELLWRLLPTHGWRVTTAGDGLTALQLAENDNYHAALAEYRLPGPNGMIVLEHVRRMSPAATLVLYGNYLPHNAKEWAKEHGAVALRKGATESVSLLLTALEDA